MKKLKYIVCIFCCMSFIAGCTMNEKSDSTFYKSIQKQPQQVTMAITGDLLFEQGLYDSWNDYDFGTYFDRIKPYLDADLTIGNQEVPIGGEELGVSGVAFTFNAPKKIADQLPSVGFDFMTLSNNHSYDKGYQGVVNTLNNLHEAGIETAGLYAAQEEASQIAIVERNGIKIAILAYTYDTNENIEASHSYVVKKFLNDEHVFDEVHKEMVRRDVEAAKQEADFVITAMHWGTEFTYDLNTAQINAANYLNELGVDLIIGNHPHCLQTMETLMNENNGNETVVFYSLGNFVSSAAMVDRASVAFANMYEIGGIVNMTLIQNVKSGKIEIQDMVLIPIVNQFESGYTNFELIPFNEYSEELAQIHYQREYSSDFNYEWLKGEIQDVFKDNITIEW